MKLQSGLQRQVATPLSARPKASRTGPASRGSGRLVVEARRGGAFLREMMKQKEEEEKTKDMLPSQENVPTVTEIAWQSPLQIAQYPDPKLRAVNAKIGVFDEKLEKLAKEMMEIMYDDDGVGLAAPQVGVNIRMMVFNPEGERGKGQEYILCNPRIKDVGKKRDKMEEGCLSFPGLRGDVERSKQIIVQAQDVKGGNFTLKLEGWLARIFQHEYDHLEGRLFVDRMESKSLEKIRKGLVGMEDKFAAANPGVEIRRLPPPPAAAN